MTVLSTPPTWFADLEPMPSDQVLDHVLRHAGARHGERDDIDRRIVASVREGTEAIVDSQAQVGGYPQDPPVT